VIGDHVFTQEQRGDDDFVVCYHAETGEEIWTHHDAARFEEVVAGAGPRGTPTFHEGRIYSLGASGTLNCLDAMNGKSIWAANIVKGLACQDSAMGVRELAAGHAWAVSVFVVAPKAKESSLMGLIPVTWSGPRRRVSQLLFHSISDDRRGRANSGHFDNGIAAFDPKTERFSGSTNGSCQKCARRPTRGAERD